MGLLDNLRMASSLSKEAYASVPRWARIIRVGRKIGPMTSIDLEIHHGHQPPFVVSTTTWVPRGVKPEIGQDVTCNISSHDSHTNYAIDWNRQPQYGTPPSTIEVPEMLGPQVPSSGAAETPQNGAHPVQQFVVARRAFDEGRATEAEFERAREAYRAYLAAQALKASAEREPR